MTVVTVGSAENSEENNLIGQKGRTAWTRESDESVTKRRRFMRITHGISK